MILSKIRVIRRSACFNIFKAMQMQIVFGHIANLLGTSRGLYRIVKCLAYIFPHMKSYRARLIDSSILVLDLREAMCFPIFLHGCIPHEISEVKILKHLTRPGDLFIDVGANVGFYTALARKWVGLSGSVFAFEPNLKCIDLLKLSFSNDQNVVIVPKALGNRSGVGKLYVPEKADMATLGIARHKPKNIFEVEVIRLDDFIRDNSLPIPSVVKIDVEGMELSVIQGMGDLLNNTLQPPVIAFEYSKIFLREYNTSLSELIDYVQKRSGNAYQFFRVDYSGKLRANDIHVPTAQNDLIAVPNWRKREVESILLNE
jgi:FkbM family methyltransferase